MWDTLSKILNLTLGCLTVYLYAENRKLKKYEIIKDIELKGIEIEDLKEWYKKRKEEVDSDFSKRGLTFSGMRVEELETLKREYTRKCSKIQAEINYLKKLQKYRWIFSKWHIQ